MLVVAIFKRICCCGSRRSRPSGFKLPDTLQYGQWHYLLRRARLCRDRYLRSNDDERLLQIDTRVQDVQARVEQAESQERMRFETINGRLENLEHMLNERLQGQPAPLQHGPHLVDEKKIMLNCSPSKYGSRRTVGASPLPRSWADPQGLLSRGERSMQAYLSSLPSPQKSPSNSRSLNNRLQPLPSVSLRTNMQMEQYQPQPPRVTPEVAGVFEDFDVDRRGSLDVAQLRAALSSIGITLDTRETTTMLTKYDMNGNNLLELNEFNSLVADLRRQHATYGSYTSTDNGGAVTSRLMLQAQSPSNPVMPQYLTAEEAMELARLAVEEAMNAQAARDVPQQ